MEMRKRAVEIAGTVRKQMLCASEVNTRSILHLIVGVGFVFFAANTANSQGKQFVETAGLADSSSGEGWGDETFYEIEMLRLKRWIIENAKKLVDPVLLKEVARLKKEAENFAENEDYLLAVTWLETIWDLLQPEEDLESNDNVTLEYADDIGPGDPTLSDSEKNFTWTREVISGVDLWRHEFHFSLPQVDGFEVTSFNADGGNPFTGFRLSFDYSNHTRRSIQGYSSFKYSRDYLSGEVDLRFVNPIGKDSFWQIENRFSGNAFYRDIDLKYFQNILAMAINLRGLGPISFNVEDEFQIRRYADEAGTYPNYYHNKLKSFLKADLGSGSFVGAGYRNVNRIHPNFDINDYRENRIDFNWLQMLGEETSVSVDNELRFRDYTNVRVDTFFQDYTENYFRGGLRIPFNHNFGTELEGSITKRDYTFFSANSLPDYLLWEVEPEVYLRLGADWRVSAGFVYRNQTHQKLISRLSVVDANIDAARSIIFEDYYAYGPVFTIELLKIDGIVFSLQESFVLQRHPNTQHRNPSILGIYQDRNINSILLFFSWNLSHRWRFSALANIDDERSRRDDDNDSQNTILGLELNYLF